MCMLAIQPRCSLGTEAKAGLSPHAPPKDLQLHSPGASQSADARACVRAGELPRHGRAPRHPARRRARLYRQPGQVGASSQVRLLRSACPPGTLLLAPSSASSPGRPPSCTTPGPQVRQLPRLPCPSGMGMQTWRAGCGWAGPRVGTWLPGTEQSQVPGGGGLPPSLRPGPGTGDGASRSCRGRQAAPSWSRHPLVGAQLSRAL